MINLRDKILAVLFIAHISFIVFTFGHYVNNPKISYTVGKEPEAVMLFGVSMGLASYLYWSIELQRGEEE